jgi:hypothetical protein
MPAMMATIGADASQMEREFQKVKAMSARAGADIQRGLQAQGPAGFAAIKQANDLTRLAAASKAQSLAAQAQVAANAETMASMARVTPAVLLVAKADKDRAAAALLAADADRQKAAAAWESATVIVKSEKAIMAARADATAIRIDQAARNNRARMLRAGRAVSRLDSALETELNATNGMGWWSGAASKTAAADATAARMVAQQRVASLLSEAAATKQVAAAIMGAGRAAGNFKAGMGEVIVIMREIARGNYSRVFQSMSIAAQRFGFALVDALLSIPGLVAVAAAAIGYFTYKNLKDLNEALDGAANRLAEATNATGGYERALRRAAEAAADFTDWLKKLGESHDTLATKTDKRLAQMREEEQLRREAEGYRTKAQTDQENALEREAEMHVITIGLLQARREAEQAEAASKKAGADAATGPDALKRQGFLDNFTGTQSKTEENIKYYQAAVNQLESSVMTRSERGWGLQFGQLDPATQASRAAALMTTDIGGKKDIMSLAHAQAMLADNTKKLAEDKALEVAYSGKQRELDRVMGDTKMDATKKAEAVETLTKQRDALAYTIALHKKYDPAIEAQAGNRRMGGDHLTENQLHGAYAGASVLVDLHRQSVRHLASIDRKMKAGGNLMSGPDTGQALQFEGLV